MGEDGQAGSKEAPTDMRWGTASVTELAPTGRVGCWAVNRARREGEAAREGEEAQVRGCLLAAPHLAGRPAHGLPATGEVGAVLHLAGRPEGEETQVCRDARHNRS